MAGDRRAGPGGSRRRVGAAVFSAAALLGLVLSLSEGFGKALPPDRGSASGYLPSGLSWYLRPTGRPEDRLVFRLVVAAGSARERRSEGGYAHFVEHMAFNGTAAYPGNSLDELLDSLDGGLDLEANAFTYPDCTIYHLELPVSLPPGRGDALTLGFGILRQWVSELRFDPAEVEREKGVIRAEMREYDTPEDRLASREEEAVYGGTPLADRGILGTPDSVEGASAEDLRAFYLREYLPGRMALIAGGPFEAAEARRALELAFADVGGRGRPERSPALLRADPPGGPAIVLVSDGRRARTELRLAFREPARALRTISAWEGEYRARLAERVLAGRLGALGSDPSVPWIFLGSERREDRFGERLWRLSVSCPAGAEAETLRTLGREFGALQSGGGGPEETEIAAREVGLTLPYPDPDGYEAVESAIRRFLYGDASLDPGRADDLEAGLRDSALAAGAPPAGTASGDLPDFGGGILTVVRPGSDGAPGTDLMTSFRDGLREGGSAGPCTGPVAASPGDPAGSGSAGPASRSGAPSAIPAARVELPDGSVGLVLANGLRVRILATGSGEGWAYLGAWSPGGLASVPVPDRPAADEAPEILARAGHPETRPAALRARLAGTWTYWRADVAAREELVEVDGSSRDLELLFRLLAGSFGPPRADRSALRKAAAARAEELRLAAGPEAAFRAAREGPSSEAAPDPDPSAVESWEAEIVQAAWTDRFGDPSDFEFLAAGDFDPAEAERLAAEFLGRLPVRGTREPVPPPPAARLPGLRVLAAGDCPRGRVLAVWSLRGLAVSDFRDLEPLARDLETRLFRRLREELAETYDVLCSWKPLPGRPDSGEFRVEFEAAPDRARTLAAVLLRELGEYADGSPVREDPAVSGGPGPAEDDETVYLDLLERLRLDRAADARGMEPSAGTAGTAVSARPGYPAPLRLSELASRLLPPEAAAVFVLARD